MMACAVTDLPEPDSPTMQTISLRPTSRLTSSDRKGAVSAGGSDTVKFRMEISEVTISACAWD